MGDLISSVSTAISIAGRLREVGKNVENAEFKNLLADLNLELSESKLKLSGLIDENTELKKKIRDLTSASGETCPECKNQTFSIASSRPDPTFGELGGIQRTHRCSACGFSENRLVDSAKV